MNRLVKCRRCARSTSELFASEHGGCCTRCNRIVLRLHNAALADVQEEIQRLKHELRKLKQIKECHLTKQRVEV